MERTVFNPAQMKILHLMSYIKSPKELDEVSDVLSNYFAEKLDSEMDAFCSENNITEETIENWGKEHMRTSSK